eukprot:6568012-Pyramimonas_sp.AAC.1
MLANPKGVLRNASESKRILRNPTESSANPNGILRNPTESPANPDGIRKNPCADRAPFPSGFALARLRNP